VFGCVFAPPVGEANHANAPSHCRERIISRSGRVIEKVPPIVSNTLRLAIGKGKMKMVFERELPRCANFIGGRKIGEMYPRIFSTTSYLALDE